MKFGGQFHEVFGQLNGKRFWVAPAFGAHVRPVIAREAKPIKNQNLPTIPQLNAEFLSVKCRKSVSKVSEMCQKSVGKVSERCRKIVGKMREASTAGDFQRRKTDTLLTPF